MIKKLSEFDEATLAQMKAVYENMPNPKGEFDEYGLRMPVEALNMVDCAIIILPLEWMAEYVDGITKESIDSDDGVVDNAFLEVNEPELWNTTSVGNCAYIALHSKKENVREVALKVLNQYDDWYMKNKFHDFIKKWTALVETQNILVPAGFYNVEQLVTEINSLINSSADLTFHSETTIDRKVSIIFVPNGYSDKVVIQASLKGEGLMELLGFEFGSTNTIVPNVETFAFNLPNLQGLDEVYLRSYTLAPSSSIDSKGVLDSICVCIPINVAWGAQQIFDCKVDALCQITYPSPRNLQNIDIQLVNKRGIPVDLNGSDLRIDLRFWFDTI